jgi:dihydrofolate reductase
MAASPTRGSLLWLRKKRHILFRTTSDQEVALPSNRALVVTENMTLDGVIDLEGGWFSPAGAGGAVDTSDIEATLREHMQTQDALLLGRVTFESFREYWPKQTDDTTGVTAHLNRVQKYVLSSTLEDPQ